MVELIIVRMINNIGLAEDSKFNLDKLRLSILPCNYVMGANGHHDYNLAYDYFKGTWQKILDRLAGPDTYKCESLLNCHYLINIFYEDTVVSQIVSRVLNLELGISGDTSYLKDFAGLPQSYIAENNCKKIVSLEWNSVNPKFSRRRSGLPFVEMTMQMSIRLAKLLKADACVGLPRRMTGVNDVATGMGFKAIREDLVKYNCPVDVVVGLIHEFQEHPDDHVRQIINRLWTDKKLVFSSINFDAFEGEETKNENRYSISI